MKERIIRTIFDEEMDWKSCQFYIKGIHQDRYLDMIYDRDMITIYEDVIMIGTSNSILMVDPSDVSMINVYKQTVEELTNQVVKSMKEEEE